jgi:hypothetical protein
MITTSGAVRLPFPGPAPVTLWAATQAAGRHCGRRLCLLAAGTRPLAPVALRWRHRRGEEHGAGVERVDGSATGPAVEDNEGRTGMRAVCCRMTLDL